MGQPVKHSDRKTPWYERQEKNKRTKGTTPKRRYFLIVCEGEKTEPNYFEGFNRDLPKGIVHIEVKGEGRNTLTLVNEALELKKKQQEANTVDKVWVVFDRDSFPPANFDNAIARAKSLKFGVAWSNEAFELWYLLHFEDRKTGMRRTEYQEKLTQYLGEPYKKNDPAMYAALKERLTDAIKRAKSLDDYHRQQSTTPHASNPCTQVHTLVEALRKLRQQTSKPKRPR